MRFNAFLIFLAMQEANYKAEAYQASDFLVKGLDEVETAFASFDGEMYAGLLPTHVDASKQEEAKLMFWLFQPRKVIASDTLTIWLNGGPGCSSLSGALFENAPVTTPHYPAGYPKTKADEPLIPNEWGWNRATNMLYVEHPEGTGFSYGPAPETEDDASTSFYHFLVNFYETFPEMKDKKLFIFGESYAGYYVPSIAHKIHQKNKYRQHDEIKLEGIGIGNGWMDAKIQGPAVIDYAWWHGIIDSTTRDALHAVWQNCKEGIPLAPPFHDFTVPDECNIMGAVLAAAGAGVFPQESYMSPNTYDVTTFDLYPVLFNPKSTYYEFYNNPKVKDALHAPMDTTWLGCMPGAGRRRLEEDLPGKHLLAHDKPDSVVPYVAELLDAGIKVLVYNGDRDLSTCVQGSEMLLNGMEWSGADAWTKAQRGLWMVHEQVAGYAKSYKGLEFVVVYNSGHLVPNNVPVQALDLITRFVTDKPFLDIALPSFDAPKVERRDAIRVGVPTAHVFYVFVLAAVCFGCGYFVASRRVRKRGYERIADVPGDFGMT